MPANSTLPNNGTEVCVLSPHASLFNIVTGVFISTVIFGVTDGLIVSHSIAWIYPLATLRILVVGLWQVCVVLPQNLTRGGRERFYSEEISREEVNILGWLGWGWCVLHAPIQYLWLVKNWSNASPMLLLIRGVSICVVALPLTIDTKARYGRALGKRPGGLVAAWLFSVVTTVSLVTLGVISTIELSMFAVKIYTPSLKWWTAYIMLVMVFWTCVTLLCIPPRDIPSTSGSFGEVLSGFMMGCFAGLYAAFPLFIMMQGSSHSPGMSITNYVRCQSISWWERAIAVLP